MGSGTAEQASVSPLHQQVTGWTGLARCFFAQLCDPRQALPTLPDSDSSL